MDDRIEKRLLTAILLLVICSFAHATTIGLVPIAEGEPGSATNPLSQGEVVRLYISSSGSPGLIGLDAIACVESDNCEFTGLMFCPEDYGWWRDVFPITWYWMGRFYCSFCVDTLFCNVDSVVGHFDVRCTGPGNVVFTLSPDYEWGGSVACDFTTPVISGSLTIYQETLKVLSPNGGEALPAGSNCTIEWEDYRSDTNCPGDYLLTISCYDCLDGSTLVGSKILSNTCSYEWLVQPANCQRCLVQIADANDPNINDTSDAAFTVYECTLTTDLTGDCTIDFTDFSAMAAEWLQCGNPFDPNCVQ